VPAGDIIEHVPEVVAPFQDPLHALEDILVLDDQHRVMGLEETEHGAGEEVGALVIEPVDLPAPLFDGVKILHVPESCHPGADLLGCERDKGGKVAQLLVRLRYPVIADLGSHPVDPVQDIIQGRGQPGDLLGLEGGDKGLVQPFEDAPGHFIPAVLERPYLPAEFRPARMAPGQPDQEAGCLPDCLNHAVKEVKEDPVLGEDHVPDSHQPSIVR